MACDPRMRADHDIRADHDKGTDSRPRPDLGADIVMV